jgi:hypothetical protein
MVICGECGEHNSDDLQFCGACGAYLEWKGARADGQSVSIAAPAPNAGASQPAPHPGFQSTPQQGPHPGFQPASQQGPHPGLQPVSQQGPQPATFQGEPAPLKPTDTVPRRRHYADTPQPRPPAPGDLICGQCGTGNVSTRRFCGRCGAALAEATVVPTPWWRRLLPRRTRKVPKSGERPHRSAARGLLSRAFRVLRWVLVLLLVLAGLAYALAPGVRGWANPSLTTVARKAQSIFKPVYVPVRPVDVLASGELPDHPARAVSDGFTNTHWAMPEGGAEPVLMFRFENPVDLKRAIVRSGASDDFQSTHRPERLHLVFSTGKTTDLTLVDSPDPQILDLPGSEGATSVEIHIVSRYPAFSGPNLALTEIEFFEQES